MRIGEARHYALSLPEVTEEPHHQLSSFRVRGKIFATVPTDEEHLHIFVSEEERQIAITINPETYEKLWWGKKVVGVRVTLSKAEAADVEKMLTTAWRRKAPKTLVKIEQESQSNRNEA